MSAPKKTIGDWLGYPRCCQEAFKKDGEDLAAGREREAIALRFRIGRHSGFVPCRFCAELVAEGLLRFDDLISERICSVPFPTARGRRVLDEFLSWKTCQAVQNADARPGVCLIQGDWHPEERAGL